MNLLAALALVEDYQATAPSRGPAPPPRIKAVYYSYWDGFISFSQRLRQWHGITEINMARTYLHDLLRGLTHMHHHGVVHRDIRPDNLLLSMDANTAPPRILLIECFESCWITRAGQSLAAPHARAARYQAPEAWLQQPASFPADVWSAGLIARLLHSGWPLHELVPAPHNVGLDLCRAAGGVIDETSWPGSGTRA